MKHTLPPATPMAWAMLMAMACTCTGARAQTPPQPTFTAPPAEPMGWSCPARLSLPPQTVNADALPPGAQASLAGGSVSLSGFSAFDGPPQEGAALRPTRSATSGRQVRWLWDDAPMRTVWLSCDYAAGLVHLAWPVQQPLRSCTAAQLATTSGAGRTQAWQVNWHCEPASDRP